MLTHSRQLSESLPFDVTVVALINKMARRIWALLAHARTHQPGYAAHAG